MPIGEGIHHGSFVLVGSMATSFEKKCILLFSTQEKMAFETLVGTFKPASCFRHLGKYKIKLLQS